MEVSQIREYNGPYLVLPYEFKTLKNIFQACSEITVESLNYKLQNNYFETYFSALNAKTIVLEKEYIDKDFLEDYSSYYARCFKEYKRFCNRLHFFNTEFDENYFKAIISGNIENFKTELEKFENSYLGFIVVKNLPLTIIGRTCLKTYERNASGRFYPVTRDYKVNLFGRPLQINTLAFQEQDSVAAACATSALWSMFHGTGNIFHHPYPSPYEITRLATINFPIKTRVFPNKGLELEMIAKAINDIGLEPLFISTENEAITKTAIYAYLKAKIPLLMGFSLFNINNFSQIGRHAVTIDGYHLDENHSFIGYKPKDFNGDNLLLVRASKIDKIYVHDDQVGPFARMRFAGQVPSTNDKGELITVNNQIIPRWGLSTSWGMQNNSESNSAGPEVLLVPTYHKIRIPFQTILNQVYHFDSVVESYKVVPVFSQFLPEKIEWDIYLATGNDFKEKILIETNLTHEYKYEICIKNYPRFLWCAEAYIKNKKVIEILFDATDIEQNVFMYDYIKYDAEVCKTFADISLINYEILKQKHPVTNVIIRHLSGYNYRKLDDLKKKLNLI